MLRECKRKHSGIKATSFTPQTRVQLVRIMRQMRADAARLGFGPFDKWLQLTSGAHAILHFVHSCDTLSVYGFTARAEVQVDCV